MDSKDKDRFDAFMRLSDFRFERWKDRRQYEWRVSLGLYAIMAAATIYLKDTPTPLKYFLSIILLIVVPSHAWVWVRSNWISGQRDINSAFYYAEYARQILLRDRAPPPNEEQGPMSKWGGLTELQSKWYSFLKESPCQVEIGATALLAIVLAAYLLLGHHSGASLRLTIPT